jgi:2-keto-4-pentenoate hydratase/2-oxohepta-3-ene-1,7-dioic acid hydratase in catechol pathway
LPARIAALGTLLWWSTPKRRRPSGPCLRTYVNEDLRQDDRTGDMLFDIYEQVSYLSSAFTLEVGDVLSTGTPSGIAWHRPGMYLKPGDVVRVEIDKIGALENPVIAEPR